ncbi:UMP-CMP kinase 2, mitochondrial [Pelobates cultripes]|uniref:UMP-CMP kinase 2, mitochondrial n=1 Tax=Pelobates cultripes TaxID=61616 RepID=A0AAD1VRQ3_PELCU|nr:UMP-CMP kinase 2, mitochondrial [Pelobates cultripes]
MWSSFRLHSHSLCKRQAARFKALLVNMSSLNQGCENWRSRLFAVDANTSLGIPDPFYFTCANSSHHLPSLNAQEWPVLAQGGSAHSVCITTPQRISAARLQKALGQKLTQEVQGGCKVLRLLSYQPQDPYGSLQGGFLVLNALSCPSIQAKLQDLLGEYKQHIRFCSYQAGTEGGIWQCLWDLNGEGKEIERCRVLKVEVPDPSPLVVNIKKSALFYKLEAACSVLQECSTIIPEASEVLKLLKDARKTVNSEKKFPVIVIEGLDATGKSTLTESLKYSLRAELLKSPPECISPWRKTFDTEPTLLRRAYYAVGNYIGAAQIAEAAQMSTVIVDRYWHSTAAYSIGTEIGGGVPNLPEYHHEIYQWPSDLLKPDLVILLTVSDEERLVRIRKRGLAETVEEKELESNRMFRQKIEEAYMRMENPGCIVVDASASKETVLQHVLSIIYRHCALAL